LTQLFSCFCLTEFHAILSLLALGRALSQRPQASEGDALLVNVAAIAESIANAYTPPATGAPSRIRESDTVTQLLQAIDDGNYLETACELAGIHKKVVYDWLKRGDAGEPPFDRFSDALKRAQARAEAAEVAKVRKAGDDPRFWAASMTYLERRHPEKWARRSEDSSAPRVVVQIGLAGGEVRAAVQIESGSQVNRISDYQTRTENESVSNQSLPATTLSGFASESAERNSDTPSETSRE
jgi:hypothetical protein